jgi:ABC-type nitrate/sulfonate/bicarbonate transport system substrate-binding protein
MEMCLSARSRSVSVVVAIVALCASLALSACGGGGEAEVSGDVKVKTGWPGEYQKVSQKSIDFLKSKGWWPLPIGTQPGFSSQPLWDPLGLPKRRGLETKTTYFLSGPEINEAAAAGRVAVGLEGNFPFTSLMAQNLPTKVVAVVNPNLRHTLLVPPDSKIKSPEDLTQLGKKPVIGVVTGSSGEFFLQSMLEEMGVTSKDVVLRNLTPPDMLLMPKGLDAVVQWEPYVSEMVGDRKNARIVDTIYPHNFYMGNLWIRKEIVDQAPDVAQAVSDMFAEGVIYARANPERAKSLFRKNRVYERFSDTAMSVVVDHLSNAYKPTWIYPFADFWATENARVAKFLRESGRIKESITADSWKQRFDTSFMDKTFEEIGWKVPERPPWIPAGWRGKVGDPPYPRYRTPEDPQQKWPEPGDLVK